MATFFPCARAYLSRPPPHEGNACHGHIVPLGQGCPKEGGTLLRIGLKHLVEIPQPKQQSILLEAFPASRYSLHH